MKRWISALGVAALALVGCQSPGTSPGTSPGAETPGPVSTLEAKADTATSWFTPPDLDTLEYDESIPAWDNPALDFTRSATLRKFTSEKEFMLWLSTVSDLAREYGGGWWQPVEMAMPAPVMEAPADSAPAAAESSPTATITVTGSKIADADASNPEITNNQKRGVDEGDIVKQIGSHLVVLQDGRLFVVDLMPGDMSGLELKGASPVYRSSDEDTWYDEMLVSGRTILVTGYSYWQNASEFTVLTLNPDGSVTREATFYISSDDYYDSENYATRMIDGKLVIHTPIAFAGVGWWDSFDPPRIREWRKEDEEEGRDRDTEGEPLFRAEDIWAPVQRTLYPVLHTVTVCDIAGASDAAAPTCKSTAMIGTANYEFLVTRDSFWLWMNPEADERDGDWYPEDEAAEERLMAACDAGGKPESVADALPGTLVRLPVDGASPTVLGVRGQPQNQFSMDMDDGTFRALLDWEIGKCSPWDIETEDANLSYFDTPLSALSTTLTEVTPAAFTPVPSPGALSYEARFTERHLVYGARPGWSYYPPEDGEIVEDATAIVLDVADPRRPMRISLPHGVIRAERAGPYMALTGYRDNRGLSVSLIDLRETPRKAGTIILGQRFESENRSHAFNSAIGADGAGLIGLPTVRNEEESGRAFYWSDTSDLTFLNVTPDGMLSLSGTLLAEEEVNPAYECEVSCVDWYGNARPIFTGGRILALVNTEMIEGLLENGRVREIRRIDLTAGWVAED